MKTAQTLLRKIPTADSGRQRPKLAGFGRCRLRPVSEKRLSASVQYRPQMTTPNGRSAAFREGSAIAANLIKTAAQDSISSTLTPSGAAT
jgi:hypothetical protein